MGIGAAIVGAGALGAGASVLASQSAAGVQESAANQATNAQMSMFNTTQNNLQPYMQTGQQANTALANATGVGTANPLTSPLLQAPSANLNEANLQSTPGYQFNLTQGEKAVQNSASARGLGVSGAAQKGAANYATGLADSTYQNQYSNEVTNQTNQFNRLLALASGGQNAAANLGGYATQTGSSIGSNIIGGANANAAATVASANAIGNAANSIPNSLITSTLLQGMYGNQN